MEDTGGQAFPGEYTFSIGGTIQHEYNEGMTLRDYFAGQAVLSASNASLEIMRREISGIRFLDETAEKELRRISTEHIERTARDAYLMADAMIKERNK